MLGIELTVESKPIVTTMMLKHHVIANATAGNVVRLVPPLNIPQEDLETVIEVLLKSIKEHR